MPQVNVKITGLKTNPSNITAQAGGLSIANNIVIDAPDIAKSRRGIYKYGTINSSASGNNINFIDEFQNKIITGYNNKLAYDNGAGIFTEYTGIFTPENSLVGTRVLKAGNSFFVATNNGVKKLESYNSAFTNAGGIKAINATAATVIQSSTGFMATDTQRAYRIVWGIKDANNYLILGEPSGRVEIANSTGDYCDVALTIYIPADVTTSHFFQIYRSDASADANTVGSDEMYLVYEDNPTSGEISAGVLTVTDETPDTLAGATIYTAPTQEGIGQSNARPPSCVDMTYYKDMAMYANTHQPHFLNLTVVAVGGTAGIQLDDTLTINDVVYTAKASETAASGYFKLETGLTAAENIAETAKSIVNVINSYASNTELYAYYISGFDDLPGKIYIERRDYTDTVFYATASARGESYDPTLPVSGTTVPSSDDDFGNYVYVSKPQQPEAVPVLNYIPVGSSNTEILRIIALRDSVFVFNDSGEIWRIIGETFESMSVTLHDNTIKLISPKTAVVFNNQIFAMTNQGVVSISDSGVRVMSYDIEDKMLPLVSPTLSPDFPSLGFAVSYESDRKYILSDTSQCYVYNALTNSWTIWDIMFYSGFVKDSTDKLYLGNNNGYVYQERKTLDKTDFVDEEYINEIISYSGYDIVLDNVSNVAVGDAIKQGSRNAIITAINGTTITVDARRTWEIGTATDVLIQKPIQCEMQFLPMYGDNPYAVKRWNELTFLFNSMNKEFEVAYTNNFNVSLEETVTISPSSSGIGWGTLPWGTGAWGGDDTLSQENRTNFPIAYMRAIWQKIKITTSIPYTNFSLIGIIAQYENISTRFTKDSA